MICKPCAAEADTLAAGKPFDVTPRCPICRAAVGLTPRGYVKRHECTSGRVKPYIPGHAACTGCDCAHKFVGSHRAPSA